MSTIKNQRCFTEATASARLILATGLLYDYQKHQFLFVCVVLFLSSVSCNVPNISDSVHPLIC